MKLPITIFLLLLSTMLYAQNGRSDSTVISNRKPQTISPASSKPSIPISPAVNTTVINNQPASLPSSNTNPVTGTVISVKKNKKVSKENSQSTVSPDTNPVMKSTDTTLNGTRRKSKSSTTEKNKVAKPTNGN